MNAQLTTAIDKLHTLSAERQREVADVLNMLVEQEMSEVLLSDVQRTDVIKRLSSKMNYASHTLVESFFNKRFA